MKKDVLVSCELEQTIFILGDGSLLLRKLHSFRRCDVAEASNGQVVGPLLREESAQGESSNETCTVHYSLKSSLSLEVLFEADHSARV